MSVSVCKRAVDMSAPILLPARLMCHRVAVCLMRCDRRINDENARRLVAAIVRARGAA